MKTIELTDQEQSIIESALNHYWNDAEIQLQNKGRYTPIGKIPSGDIETQLLIKQQELVLPILRRFEKL
jgi:hypothetical protein